MPLRFLTLLVALLAPLAFAGCDLRYALFGLPAPSYESATRGPIELPFRESAGLMLVAGTVNGTPVEFVLDTGAPVTVLVNGPQLAPLALDTRGARKLGAEDNPAVPVGVIRPGFTLAFGPLTLSQLTAVVIEGNNMPCRERFEKAGFAGVIGADLFRRFVIEVDHGRQRLVLHEPATWRPAASVGEFALDFRGGLPFTEVELRGESPVHAVRLLVDTGANDTLTLIAGSRPELKLPTNAERRESCFVAGTRTTWRGAPLDLVLGRAVAPQVATSYEDGDKVLRGERHGSLGIGLLKRYAFAVDYPGKRIVLLRAL
jgi:hypothetical protein